MQSGKTRQIDGLSWIELFPETPQDILYTMRVLNRAHATRAEPTRYNNARDLQKYARTGQTPILARVDAWQAMQRHLAVKKERYERLRVLKRKRHVKQALEKMGVA